MNRIILIDTNMYLDDPNIIYKLAKDYDKILIPLTVLKELDKKKRDKDLSYSARSAVQAISDFEKNFKDQVIFDPENYDTGNNDNDEKIIASAKKYNASIATKDKSMSILAKSLNIASILHDTVLNNIFKPYIYLNMDDIFKYTIDNPFCYKDIYYNEDYENTLIMFSNLIKRPLIKDAWWFIIIEMEDENKIIYANNPMNYELIRIDNKPNHREIKVEDVVIKARDCYQICAIYALNEAPHTLITGRWGSGKTLLASAHALARTKKKTFITRAPIGLNTKYDIGFLPGDMEDKMMNWLQGFTSALYYLYANTRGDKDDNGKTYDYVREEIFHKKFQIMPMNSIQGLSLLDNDTLIVDEVQLVDINYMSMIMSRPSETGRLVLLGDIKQTYDVVRPSESGLLKLLRVLPHKYMAYVELQNSYRSPLLELADKLQNKSIGI